MAIMVKARNETYDVASEPVYDDNDVVTNLISTVDDDSILFFASAKRTTGYTDISGETVKIVIHDDARDDVGKPIYDEKGNPVVVEKSAVVEIVKSTATKIFFKFNGDVWNVPKSNAKLYKI